jgi:hypothetical protein
MPLDEKYEKKGREKRGKGGGIMQKVCILGGGKMGLEQKFSPLLVLVCTVDVSVLACCLLNDIMFFSLVI